MTMYEELMKEKQIQENIMKGSQATLGTSMGIGGMSQCATTNAKPAPLELRERVRRGRERSGVEIDRFSKFQELEYLLDKNPEIARILELMEATGQR